MTASTENRKEEAKEAPTPSDREHNFEMLRRKLEATEHAKTQAEAKAASFEKQVADFQKQKTREDEEDDRYDEPYVDERRLTKRLSKFEESFEKKVDERAEKKARMLLEQDKNTQFMKQHPDFEQVLSRESIEKFATQHPEIAEPMLEMPEGFARQKLLYQQIRAFSEAKKQEPRSSVQDTIDKNQRGQFYRPSGANAPPYGGAIGAGKEFSETEMKTAYDQVAALRSRLRI